jgi:HJR/Mrr/RecB family endonuclease
VDLLTGGVGGGAPDWDWDKATVVILDQNSVDSRHMEWFQELTHLISSIWHFDASKARVSERARKSIEKAKVVVSVHAAIDLLEDLYIDLSPNPTYIHYILVPRGSQRFRPRAGDYIPTHQYIVGNDPKHDEAFLVSSILQVLQVPYPFAFDIVAPPTPTVAVLNDRYHWDEILKQIHKDFPSIYSIDPRKFEELVAELLDRDEFKVQITPKTRDGGRDIFAYKESDLGTHLFLVECKRYAAHRKIGLDIVQRLHGVRDDDRASAAVIVTTAGFSPDAKKFEEKNKHLLSLRDGTYLQGWIDRVVKTGP